MTPNSDTLNSVAEDEKTDPFITLPPQGSESVQPTAHGTSPLPKVKMPELGPLDPLMKDPRVTEIMVNDLRNVIIEKDGKLSPSSVTIKEIDELNRLTRNILDFTGRILSPDSPYTDTVLPDGSRVNIIGPPLTQNGPCITIRKAPSQPLSIHDLMVSRTLDQRIAYFLNACVIGKLNILISGGTGSGKTTLLNVLHSFIPKEERIVCIEDTPELIVRHMNSVKLQTKPRTPTSAPIDTRELVANSLRMRPDRIIVGECRRAEAFDMLQAMNTGHSGSMTTIHANTPRDGLTRLETLCMLAGVDIPVSAIRKQIASALDLIIQVQRFRDGKRRVTAVTEVIGMEGEVITLQDLFSYESENGINGKEGSFKSLGFVPTFLDRLREHGVTLENNYFG